MEEYTNEDQQTASQLKRWFQDNLRIIVSIVIVAAIASGIYSYSKRVDAPAVSDEQAASDEATDSNEGVEVTDNEDKATQTETEKAAKQETVVPAESSQETENAFVETAGKNDSATRLARRALANYLEKNPDSQLTKEHKIYIEDYLRKNVTKKSVRVGTSIEFSKDLIQKGIDQSKKLNEGQLKNLEKYSARVTSLS